MENKSFLDELRKTDLPFVFHTNKNHFENLHLLIFA